MSDRVALVVTVLMSADVNCASTKGEGEMDSTAVNHGVNGER